MHRIAEPSWPTTRGTNKHDPSAAPSCMLDLTVVLCCLRHPQRSAFCIWGDCADESFTVAVLQVIPCVEQRPQPDDAIPTLFIAVLGSSPGDGASGHGGVG